MSWRKEPDVSAVHPISLKATSAALSSDMIFMLVSFIYDILVVTPPGLKLKMSTFPRNS